MHLVHFSNKTNLNDLNLDKVGQSTTTSFSAPNDLSRYRRNGITRHNDVSINIVCVILITFILMYYR